MTTQYEPTFVNETLQNEMLNLVLTALGMAEDGDHYTDMPYYFYHLIQLPSEEEVLSFMNTCTEDYESCMESLSYDNSGHPIFKKSLGICETIKQMKEYMAWRMLKELMYCFDLETSIDLSLAHIWKEEQPHQQFISYIQQHLA